MKVITINSREIKLNITKKPNKNTYFYFKKEGYIQINLSKYQTEKYAVNFIKQNATAFLKKYDKATITRIPDKSKYYLLGQELNIKSSDNVDKIMITETECIQPAISTDQLKSMMKRFEKQQLLDILNNLRLKYIDNGVVNISDIHIKTRYTTTRFGSCNARLRNINMSTHLIHYDIKYIEYVFLHEICHLKFQDHSVNFYNVLKKLCPNYKQLRKELKTIYR